MDRDKLDFGNGRIKSLFLAMFSPTLIGMLFNSVLNICDGMFVGHGVGSNALAAINIVAPLFLVCTGVGLMFGIGASVIGGIRLAEGNVKAARIIMTQAYIAGGVIFGFVILVSLLFTRPLLYALGCSEALEQNATDYLLWLLPGLLFFYLQCAGMMLIRLDGSPKYARRIQEWAKGNVDCHLAELYRGRRHGVGIFHILLQDLEVLPSEDVGEIAEAFVTQCRIHGQDRTRHLHR